MNRAAWIAYRDELSRLRNMIKEKKITRRNFNDFPFIIAEFRIVVLQAIDRFAQEMVSDWGIDERLRVTKSRAEFDEFVGPLANRIAMAMLRSFL